MRSADFDKIVNERIEKIKKILGSKAKEYASNEDRLYNFKRAAEMDRTTPAKALWGMMAKHRVSVADLVEGEGCVVMDQESYKALIEEKIGDSINYLILLEAILKEYLNEKISTSE